MFTSKIWASAVVWWTLALPLAYSQSTLLNPPKPKWEFGVRGGVGFNLSHFKQEGNGYYVYPYSLVTHDYYLGGLATYNFNQHWSLRSELSWMSLADRKNAIAIGIFPRYYLTNWLGIEAGVETRNVLGKGTSSSSKFWIGTAVKYKNMEFNARFSPSRTPGILNLEHKWQSSFQVGMSINLAKKGKRS